jgi:hypothetical protein
MEAVGSPETLTTYKITLFLRLENQNICFHHYENHRFHIKCVLKEFYILECDVLQKFTYVSDECFQGRRIGQASNQ